MEIREEYNTLLILTEMIENLNTLHTIFDQGEKEISLKVKQYVTPTHILPLAVYSILNGVKVDYSENEESVCSYLKTISFPQGTSVLLDRGKTYLPITRISCADDDSTLGKYENRILHKNRSQRMQSSFKTCVKYLTSELVNNIKEHARIDDYWILSQYWDKTKTCEVAVLDTGVGYKASYEGTRYEVDTHLDAIRNAIEGRSSKTFEERGRGIPSLIELFCEGFGGELVIMSGNALVYGNNNGLKPFIIDFEWNGSLIGIRFNLSAKNPLAYL